MKDFTKLSDYIFSSHELRSLPPNCTILQVVTNGNKYAVCQIKPPLVLQQMPPLKHSPMHNTMCTNPLGTSLSITQIQITVNTFNSDKENKERLHTASPTVTISGSHL